MLRDPNVACLEGIACQAHEEHILGCKIFWGGVRFGTGRNFDYLPAFSFCRDTWPCRCCPWPLLRRPGKAQTGTFDAPATDVSIFWGPTHGRYPEITNIRLWGLDRAYNKLFDRPEGWHRRGDHWWDHNHQGGRGGEHRWPSEALTGTRPNPPWSHQPGKIKMIIFIDQRYRENNYFSSGLIQLR